MITSSERKRLEESYLQAIRAEVALTKCAVGLILVIVIGLIGGTTPENKPNATTVSVPRAVSDR